MNGKVVVTIGREFGSGGREIGEKLAKRLGIAYYDRNILDMVAEKSGIDKKYLEAEDEKASNAFDEPYVPHWLDTGTLSERLFRMQSKIQMSNLIFQSWQNHLKLKDLHSRKKLKNVI